MVRRHWWCTALSRRLQSLQQRPYPVSYAMRQTLGNKLEEIEHLKIIRKINSTHASPVVVVKKKNGFNRACVDYKRLNKLTVFDPPPVITPVDAFLGTENDRSFSKIDLSKGYWWIPVRQEVNPKAEIVTMDLHSEFHRMPFGIMNLIATLAKLWRCW
ncbi:Zinc finger protein [Plakobranchus ocellatus]|uniref:Zinc finger protein n=1 Tax=Plakobranchus ocellatus TaxID=259542 RepID=A0AAV4CY41_9GAST|nr:Zinc finger protein [Plakobranchus ocellatus]